MLHLLVLFAFISAKTACASGDWENCFVGLIEMASGPAYPTFLIQSKYGYTEDPEFLRPMGRGIDLVADKMKAATASPHKIEFNPTLVKKYLDDLASERYHVALVKVGNPRVLFGIDCTTCNYDTVTEADGRHKEFYEPAVAALTARLKLQGKDISDITPTKPERGKLDEWMKASEVKRQLLENARDEITLRGKKVKLAAFEYKRNIEGKLEIVISHPRGYDLELLREEGYSILAEVLNDRSLTEAQTMDKLAKAYFLLMHSTPYQYGSPSIVESYIDDTLRAKFNKTILGKKTDEPFWKVMFWDTRTQGDFTGKDFLSCFTPVSLEKKDEK